MYAPLLPFLENFLSSMGRLVTGFVWVQKVVRGSDGGCDALAGPGLQSSPWGLLWNGNRHLLGSTSVEQVGVFLLMQPSLLRNSECCDDHYFGICSLVPVCVW